MKPLNFSNKWIKTVIHLIIWVIIFTLPFILYQNNDHPRHQLTDSEMNLFRYIAIGTDFLWVAAFYLNAFVLMPRLAQKKNITLYFFSVIVLFLGCIFLHFLLFVFVVNGHAFSFINAVQFNMAPFLLSVAISSIWQMWTEKQQAEKWMMQKHQETLKTELSFLRSQISPHFVLNLLNNIVALVRMKSENLEPTVMKLSALMQYMLYETNEEKVQLKSETEYLQSYIDLQQQRFGKKLQLHTDISTDNDWYEIEPMLLIPFVENAFKHGIGLIDHPQIDISLNAGNQKLKFTVRNRYNPDSTEIKDRTSGIGLVNVKRRLKLLYGKDHDLMIVQQDGWFIVSLTLNLRT